MKRGRKNLKQGASKQKECQSIAQVVSVRGSNQIEIMDEKVENSLALTQQQEGSRRKRRRGRERGIMFQIPPDLVIEILIRLPAKSMVRFKCVSKQWSSLIAGRYLCNRLFTVTRRQQQQQPHLYMCLKDGGGQRVLLSVSPDNNTCCYVVDQDLSIPGIGGLVLNVVRGLMCFSVRKKACIYNPTTRQLLTLPSLKSDITAEQGQKKSSHYYIGHDPINDQYKVFCTIEISSERITNMKSEHWVFILEAGGSWKKVVVPLENYYPHAPAEAGLFINGVVHYMAWIDMYTCAVVSIDITSEEVTTILVPRKIRDVPLPALMMKADLIEYGGKLAIFNHSYLKDDGLVNLWVLKDAGRNKWSNKRLVLQPCQRHLVHDIDFIVKGTTQDGKVILVPLEMRSQFYILCYDVQSNDLRKVEIKGVPRLWFNNRCSFDLKFMDESESFIYLET